MTSLALARSALAKRCQARQIFCPQRWASSSSGQSESQRKRVDDTKRADNKDTLDTVKKVQKTMEEADEEMRRAMENLAGDGGDAGVELEDGKPVAMKRGVRENMFRYI